MTNNINNINKINKNGMQIVLLSLCILFFTSISMFASDNPNPRFDNDHFGYEDFSEAIPGYYNPNEEDPFAGIKTFFNNIKNYTDKINPNIKIDLPVGIKKKVDNIDYTIGVYEMKFGPTYTELSAFARVIIPQKDGSGEKMELFFVGSGIRISSQGGIYGHNASLKLMANCKINLGENKSFLILKGGKNRTDATYIDIDCNGFKEMQLNADILFSRDFLQPVGANFKIIDNPKSFVTGSFKVKVRNWNDILVDNISFTPFTMAGANGFSFQIDRAAFDFSDLDNISGLRFPETYPNGEALKNDKTWRGVYIRKIQVNLPPNFDRKGNNITTSISANEVIIDNRSGLSGKFKGENLLHIDDGKAGGWPISVSKLQIDIVANELINGSVEGNIKIPIDSTSMLKYNGSISKANGFQLVVQPTDTLQFNLWDAAKVNLDANSKIELTVKGDVFEPKATLHGAMNIVTKETNATTTTANTADNATKMNGIVFQELVLQTKSPYIAVKHLGYDGEINLGTIPASIKEISVTTNDSIAKLKFGVTVGLTGKKDGNFGGSTYLEIAGKFAKETDQWVYDYTKVNGVGVDMDFGAFTIKGEVRRFEDDATYGNGFMGKLNFKLKALGEMGVEAKALFGNNKIYPYWYVDAKAALGSMSIPVGVGLFINAFEGGAYGNMRPAGLAANPNSIGASASGLVYKPDSSIAIGIRAGIGLKALTEEAFNARAAIEFTFNKNGGLDFIRLNGDANIMAPMPELTTFNNDLKKTLTSLSKPVVERKQDDKANLVINAAIKATLDINYDFKNSTFKGTLDGYLNAGPLTGTGENGHIGQIDVLFSPQNWHVKVGEPSKRLGVKFGLLGSSIAFQTYFMTGTNLPGSPAPPEKVWQAMAVSDKEKMGNYMQGLNNRTCEEGFAFGANVAVNTDLNYLLFYGNFDAGVGFDVMIKKYTNTSCKGMAPGQKIGIDGWYANGQAYSYINADIGVDVNLLFVKGKFSVLKIGAGALLQAQLPNPSWFSGTVGGQFSILGGLVSGQCNFNVTFGDKCEPQDINNKPLAMDAIADIKPVNNEPATDVFAVPQVVFNYKVGQVFSVNDNGASKQYKILLEKFEVLKNGTIPVNATLKWNETNDKASLYAKDILDPKTAFTLVAIVSFMENIGGTWKTVVFNGTPAIEEKRIEFTTGEAPDYIPVQNILFAYPVPDQKNYFKGEYNNGYIQLKQGQSYLFNDARYTKQLQVKTAAGQITSGGTYSYNESLRRVNWQMPNTDNATNYTLELINAANVEAGASTVGVTNISTSEGINVRTKTIEGTVKNSTASAKVIMSYGFRTSMYNTLSEKITSIQYDNSDTYLNIDPETPPIGAVVKPVDELFDMTELMGNNYTRHTADNENILPLVQPEAVLDNSNRYYAEKIYPMQYQPFSFDGSISVEQLNSTANLRKAGNSLIPNWAIYPHTQYKANINNPISGTYKTFPYVFFATKQFKSDWDPIKIAVTAKFPNDFATRYPALFAPGNTQVNYPVITNTLYKIKLTYTLPGNIGTGTSGIFTIDYKAGQGSTSGGGIQQ